MLVALLDDLGGGGDAGVAGRQAGGPGHGVDLARVVVERLLAGQVTLGGLGEGLVVVEDLLGLAIDRQKPKIGRPTIDGTPKETVLTVRLSSPERAAIGEAAQRAGTSSSAWARRVLLDAAMAKPLDVEPREHRLEPVVRGHGVRTLAFLHEAPVVLPAALLRSA